MARMDYTDIIADIVQPLVIDNVVETEMNKLESLFTKNTMIKSGDKITDPNCIARTGAGGAFTRADANPVSMTQTFINPYWNKLYYHESANVRREDLAEAKEGTPLLALLQDAANSATKKVMGYVFDGIMTQLIADVDDTGTYSDNADARVAAITSYEENTNALITLNYMRTAHKTLALKKTIDWSQYVWLLEQTVLNTAHPLMSETGSWVAQPNGTEAATGYVPVGTFDGIKVDTTYGMTVGNCFLLDRNDVQIQTHMPFHLEWVPVDEFAFKVVARIGVNGWCRHPAFQAKLTLKD